MPIVHADDSSFDSLVLSAAHPVLVDFWGPSCGPCVVIAPVLEELAEEFADRLTIAMVDVSTNPGLTAAYGVLAIPQLSFFVDGECIDSLRGGRPKRVLREYLETKLAALS